MLKFSDAIPKHILCGQKWSVRKKVLLYKAFVRTALTNVGETWSMRKEEEGVL